MLRVAIALVRILSLAFVGGVALAAALPGEAQANTAMATVTFTPTSGPGGTLSARAYGADFSSGSLAAVGSTVTFTAAPANDYFVSGWSGNCHNIGATGFALVPGQERQCKLRITANGAMVGATFTKVWTVTVSPVAEGGNIRIESREPLGPRFYESSATVAENSTVIFRATPEAGYFLREWTGDCQGMPGGMPADTRDPGEIECALTATKNLTAGAVFEKAWRVIFPARAGGTVSARIKDGAKLSDSERVTDGVTVIFTARPKEMFYVAGWSDARCNVAENIGRETEPGPAHPRSCELAAETELFVTVTFSAGIFSPIAPVNFQAALVSLGSRTTITLTWETPKPANNRSTVARYRVWRAEAPPSTSANCANAVFPDGVGVALETPGVSNLKEGDVSAFHDVTESGHGKCHRYGLAAVNAAGPSPTVFAPGVYAQGLPDAARNLQATLLADNVVSLSWSAPPTLRGAVISSYEILRGQQNPAAAAAVVAMVAAAATTHLDSDAPGSATLIYYVRPLSGAGRGPLSAASGPVETNPVCPAGGIVSGRACVCDAANFYVRAPDGERCAPGGRVELSVDNNVGGELVAQTGGQDVRSGGLYPDGATVTAMARPSFGYYVEDWTFPVKIPDSEQCPAGNNDDGGEKSCVDKVVANQTLDFVVSFARQTRALDFGWTPSGGSVRAGWEEDSDVSPDGTVPRGVTVTLTALPDSGHEVSLWSGACSGAGTAARCVLTATVNFRASVSFADIDECARNTHNCAANQNRVCQNRAGGFDCPCDDDSGYGDLNGFCAHRTDGLPQNRATCEDVFGGDWLALGDAPDDPPGICSNIDFNDTFCIAHPDSGAALSCAGLFKHVRDCNLLYGRPALDMFHCAGACPSRRAAGARCLPQEDEGAKTK